MLLDHLPALIIVIPLMAGPLCVMARHPLVSWIFAILANAAIVVMALRVFEQVYTHGAIRYALGGWAAPTGIEYYIDTLNATLLVLISTISLITLVYSLRASRKEIAKQRHYLFYAGWILCLTGLLGIVITGDAFNVFVFLEISSLSMYMLIALGNERKQALMAAFRYLIMGSVGASFILIGIGFLYAATGTLNMIDLADTIPQVSESRTVLVAFAFITIGLLIKAAVFPAHSWLPNAYQYSPTAVTAFLAGTATKVSLYIFLRFFFQIFGDDYSFGKLLLGDVILPLAVIGFLTMSIVAVFQTDIRRILAYSSIAQVGYIVAAISMATQEGVTAGIVHMINHAFIKSALFVAVGCMVYRLGNARVSSVGNLIRIMPWTSAAFIIAGLSLIGVPLTAGFVSKWSLVSAAMSVGWWPIVAMVLLSSLFAVIYIGKIIESFCFNSSIADIATVYDVNAIRVKRKEAPALMLVALWALVIISVYTGINGEIVVNIATVAAEQLLAGFDATLALSNNVPLGTEIADSSLGDSSILNSVVDGAEGLSDQTSEGHTEGVVQ